MIGDIPYGRGVSIVRDEQRNVFRHFFLPVCDSFHTSLLESVLEQMLDRISHFRLVWPVGPHQDFCLVRSAKRDDPHARRFVPRLPSGSTA